MSSGQEAADSAADSAVGSVGASARACIFGSGRLANGFRGGTVEGHAFFESAKTSCRPAQRVWQMTADARELAAHFDLERLTPEFYVNPYPTYRALRENEPVKRMPNGSYFLTRYDDLVTAYKNTKAFSSDKKKEFAPKYGDSLLYEHHTTSLVFNDPPAHTRVRRLIMGALSPRAIAEMEGDLIRLVDGLLDAIQAKSDEKGDFDLIGDFAAAIPIEVIGNLLDVPHDEREPLRDWSLAILGALEPVIGPE